MRLFSSVLLAALLAVSCGDEPTEPVADPAQDRSMEHPPITPGAPGLEPRHVGHRTICAGGERSCALFDGRPACWSGSAVPAFVGDTSGADRLACDATTLCVHVPPDRVDCGEVTLPVESLAALWVREGSVCLRDAAGVRCWAAGDVIDPESAEVHAEAIEVLRGEGSTCVLRADALICEPTLEMGQMPALRHLDGDSERCGVDPQRRQVWCWSDETPSRVAAFEEADAVVVGGAQICVRASGHARCVARGDRQSARDVGLEGVVELAVGAAHACARARDGSLHCWGEGGGAPVEVPLPR